MREAEGESGENREKERGSKSGRKKFRGGEKFFKVEIYFDDIVKIRKTKGGSLLKFEFRRYGKLYISNI